jgi:hypothetical protein
VIAFALLAKDDRDGYAIMQDVETKWRDQR